MLAAEVKDVQCNKSVKMTGGRMELFYYEPRSLDGHWLNYCKQQELCIVTACFARLGSAPHQVGQPRNAVPDMLQGWREAAAGGAVDLVGAGSAALFAFRLD